MRRFNLNNKKTVAIALFSFLIVTPLIVFYASSSDSFDTRSSAGELLELRSDLKSGDLNADNKISISDYTIWLEAYKKYARQSTVTESCDFNKSGSISITDFNMWIEMYKNYLHWYETKISFTDYILQVGDIRQLEAKFSQESSSVKMWTSSNEKVIMVDNNGKIEALSEGTATVHVYGTAGEEDSITITVEGGEGDTSYIIDANGNKVSSNSAYKMVVGSTEKFTAVLGGSNKSITWNSSDTSVATVSDGLVKAIAVGNTTITANGSGGKSATISLTVVENTATEGIKIYKDGKDVTYDSTMPTSVPLKVGESVTFTTSISSNSSATWTSSKTSVASVDQSGKVTGVSVGEAMISVISGNTTGSVHVEVIDSGNEFAIYDEDGNAVTSITIGVSETKTLKTPYASGVEWSSENKGVATVSAGKVTGVSAGTTTIHAKHGEKIINVVVNVIIPIKSFSINNCESGAYSQSIMNGNSMNMSLNVEPATAGVNQLTLLTSGYFVWSLTSGNSVEVKGNTIKAVASGESVITVTTSDNQFTKTCKITVM